MSLHFGRFSPSGNFFLTLSPAVTHRRDLISRESAYSRQPPIRCRWIPARRHNILFIFGFDFSLGFRRYKYIHMCCGIGGRKGVARSQSIGCDLSGPRWSVFVTVLALLPHNVTIYNRRRLSRPPPRKIVVVNRAGTCPSSNSGKIDVCLFFFCLFLASDSADMSRNVLDKSSVAQFT